jgi:hypothetical protein
MIDHRQNFLGGGDVIARVQVIYPVDIDATGPQSIQKSIQIL